MDETPQQVLSDYQNRTVVSVSNLRWVNSDQTMFDADVLFQELEAFGPVPFTAVDGADTRHGREIWEKAINGDYGSIAEYVPPPEPSPEEIREAMPPLTARQLRLGLVDNGYSVAQVEAAIAAIADETEREKAQIEWEYASEYRRTHPLIGQIAAALGLTAEQIDAMWVSAASL